jgi:hypothetical protein
MRETLGQLGEDLASQLDDEGNAPNVNRNWHDSDERTWDNRRTTFAVDPSRYKSTERISSSEKVSDAMLVSETVRQTIVQREEGIRKVYGQILSDATARRSDSEESEGI